MKNSEQPAYPNEKLVEAQMEGNFSSKEFQGLTKREYFAAMAMQGLLAEQIDSEGALKSLHMNPESLCFAVVKYADALLSELEK